MSDAPDPELLEIERRRSRILGWLFLAIAFFDLAAACALMK